MTVFHILTPLLLIVVSLHNCYLTFKYLQLRREFAIVEQIMVPFLEWIKEVQQANEKYADEATK